MRSRRTDPQRCTGSRSGGGWVVSESGASGDRFADARILKGLTSMEPVVYVGILIVVLYLFSCINVLAEYERGVVFRLGRVLPEPKGPGLIFIFGPSTASCVSRSG